MIGWIAIRLVGAGVSDRFARAIAWALVVAIVALAIVAIVSVRDRRILDAHDANRRADEAAATIDRSNKADAGELAARAVDQQQREQLQGVIDNAVSANPDAAGAGVGPASRAALDELRRRQQARQSRQ